MSNPVLQSESFERAAYELRNAMGGFPGIEFTAAIDRFEQSVNRMARILGMQAENEQRKSVGQSMAYTEADFVNA